MSANEHDVADTLIAMERAALDRWGKSDPSGYLEISAPEVVYFDPFLERRIDGREALADYSETLRGKVQLDRQELINPRVQLYGEAAVLTFNSMPYFTGGRLGWNCTEVYQHTAENWHIVQTHWSVTQHLAKEMFHRTARNGRRIATQ